MEQRLYLTSPIPPSVNHYTATRAIIKNGKPLCIVYKTKDAAAYQKEFKQVVAKAVEEQGWVTDLCSGRHFYADAVFYMDRTHRDCNNTWKCMLDAITETQLVWPDDDVVCENVKKILYDPENPRVELCIHYVDYVGIFNTEEQMEEFKISNCVDCKRYKRNCTLLKKAIHGLIQEEIDGVTCSKCSALKTKDIKE